METPLDVLRERILSAIRRIVPELSDDEFLFRFADELDADSGMDSILVEQVLADLIASPPVELETSDEYWRGIAALGGMLREHPKPNILVACRYKLFSFGGSLPRSQVYALNCVLLAYLASGGTVSEEDVSGRFLFLRETDPFPWMTMAVMSGHGSLFEKEAIGLLTDEGITFQNGRLATFVEALSLWKENWSDGSDFLAVVRRFRDVIVDKDGRDAIDRWIDCCGQKG